MKHIQFTQITDSRFSGTKKELSTRLKMLKRILNNSGIDFYHGHIRQVDFPDGSPQWRSDCRASGNTTKKKMMKIVNTIKPVYYH